MVSTEKRRRIYGSAVGQCDRQTGGGRLRRRRTDGCGGVSSVGRGVVFAAKHGGFTRVAWGTPTDEPTAADYDGDGRTDVAIYRSGVWWIINSTSNTSSVVGFGLGNDKPIPNAYVP